MEIPVYIAIAIGVAALALPAIGIFMIPKVARFLKSKGLDDETLEFIDLVDDYFDEVETFAGASGIKGADKLAAALIGMVEKLERELTEQELEVAKKRITKRALQEKAVRAGGSIQLDGPGMG